MDEANLFGEAIAPEEVRKKTVGAGKPAGPAKLLRAQRNQVLRRLMVRHRLQHAQTAGDRLTAVLSNLQPSIRNHERAGNSRTQACGAGPAGALRIRPLRLSNPRARRLGWRRAP